MYSASSKPKLTLFRFSTYQIFTEIVQVLPISAGSYKINAGQKWLELRARAELPSWSRTRHSCAVSIQWEHGHEDDNDDDDDDDDDDNEDDDGDDCNGGDDGDKKDDDDDDDEDDDNEDNVDGNVLPWQVVSATCTCARGRGGR